MELLSFLAFADNFKWYHWIVIGALGVIIIIAVILFRFNTKTQMKVSFNMDDETEVYNPKGFDVFINNNAKKINNPTVVVVEIKNLVIVYKDYPKKRNLMMRIADLLLKGLKDEEAIGRIEFNKFAIIFSNRDKAEIRERLLDFDKALNDPDFDKYIDIKFIINFGVNEKPRLDEGYNNVTLAESSISLSPVKDKNIYYYCDEVTVSLGKRNRMNEAKQIAYDEKRFVSYIQPKVSLATGEVIGGEILCRWVDEMQNPIYSPGEFIPLFESNGFIKQIDDLMFENACMMAATLVRRGYNDTVISVNLSKADMDGTDIVKKLLEVCNKHMVSPKNIEVEITESAVMSNSKYISSIIMQLRQSGFHVAMDDFGKEYSSLSSLADNPFDTIKIDGVFFKDGLQTEKTKNIAKDILTMLSKLNCEIVCEGVETKETLDIIASINRDVVIQGYYFSKPIPTYQFESFVETKYEFDFPEPEKEMVAGNGELNTEEIDALKARIQELEQIIEDKDKNSVVEENKRLLEQMEYMRQNPYQQNPYQQNPYQQNPYVQTPYPYPPYGYPYPQQQQPYPQQPYPQQQQSNAEIEALKREIEALKNSSNQNVDTNTTSNTEEPANDVEEQVKPSTHAKKSKKAKKEVVEEVAVDNIEEVQEESDLGSVSDDSLPEVTEEYISDEYQPEYSEEVEPEVDDIQEEPAEDVEIDNQEDEVYEEVIDESQDDISEEATEEIVEDSDSEIDELEQYLDSLPEKEVEEKTDEEEFEDLINSIPEKQVEDNPKDSIKASVKRKPRSKNKDN